MEKRKLLFFWLIFITGSTLLFLWGCSREGGAPEGEKATEESPVLRLDPERSQMAGVKTARVESRLISIPVKATGTITFNRAKFVCLSSRVQGRVEQVYAFEGDRVEAGDLLAAIYSDEFLAAQLEFIQLLGRHQRALDSRDEEASLLSSKLLDSAAQRLRLMGLTELEIEHLRETKNLSHDLFLRAPLGGSILTSRASAGAYVERGSELFEVADLTTVWAEVDIFEKDLALVKPGSRAEVRVQAYPGESFSGQLASVGDVVNETTRTIKGRVEIPNRHRRLKPGMFVEAILLAASASKAIVAPVMAVRSLEGKSVVFVSTGENIFEIRPVKVGRIIDDWVEILDGIKEDEVVVTEGSFSLKAEVLKKTLGGEE